MTRQELERFLEQGHELGFVKETDDPEFLGWILLRKRKPNQRLISIINPDEDADIMATEQMLSVRPYQVQVIELSKAVFEADRYETEKDYRVNDVSYFSCLDDVQQFVGTFGLFLEDIKWRIEINAP